MMMMSKISRMQGNTRQIFVYIIKRLSICEFHSCSHFTFHIIAFRKVSRTNNAM